MSRRDWLIVLGLCLLVFYTLKVAASGEPNPCPIGSYQIDVRDGKPLCRLHPTGCPYGDSIPQDSPKCAPPTTTAEPAEKVMSQNKLTTDYSWGK